MCTFFAVVRLRHSYKVCLLRNENFLEFPEIYKKMLRNFGKVFENFRKILEFSENSRNDLKYDNFVTLAVEAGLFGVVFGDAGVTSTATVFRRCGFSRGWLFGPPESYRIRGFGSLSKILF